MFLTNITLFGCMVCILCNSSSFINVASASSIRYADVNPVVKIIPSYQFSINVIIQCLLVAKIYILYSRNVYEDSGGGTLGDRIRSKSSIVRSRRDVENVEIEKNEGNSLRKLTLSQTNSQSNHPSTVRLNKRSLWASWHKPLEYKDTSNSRQKSTFNQITLCIQQ